MEESRKKSDKRQRNTREVKGVDKGEIRGYCKGGLKNF
jgi:hypothetical protein